jgi:hypothetical protein
MNGVVRINYYIKIWLESVKEPIVLSVTGKDTQRFFRNYEDNRMSFFVCETKNGKYVAVNLKYVQLAHLLWDSSLDDEIIEEDDGWVALHFLNRDPMFFIVGEPVELVGIFSTLDTGIDDEVMSFTDIDGERLLFDPQTLLLLEAPIAVVAEGEREILEKDKISD